MGKRQYIYVFSNPSMPGLLKIGSTKRNPSKRSQELYTTGVPTPFVLEYSCVVADCCASERQAHRALDRYRVTQNREFFRISLNAAMKKILATVGSVQEVERRGSTERRSVGSVESVVNGRRGAGATKRKVVPKKTVAVPAAWPFPTSSRP